MKNRVLWFCLGGVLLVALAIWFFPELHVKADQKEDTMLQNGKTDQIENDALAQDKADLMGDITPNRIDWNPLTQEVKAKLSDFSLRLFTATSSQKNTLLSPISLLSALGMVQAGAGGETLAQMETTIGLPKDTLSNSLYSYFYTLPQSDTARLKNANSLWVKEGYKLQSDFLQHNGDFYGAQMYASSFDKKTVEEINNWVTEHTDGLIEEFLQDIPPEAITYLLNAIAFDAEWKEKYDEFSMRPGTFTTEQGEVHDVEMMRSSESQYVEHELATGFIKPYVDHESYDFVALLPKDGVSVEQLLNNLSGQQLAAMLTSPQETTVETAMPKFQYEFTISLPETLQKLGIVDVFHSEKADLSAMFESGPVLEPLSIGEVLQKTYITIDEQGTRAGAATRVEVLAGSGFVDEYKTVTLDRPFVFLIIDHKNKLPLFIGTLMNPQQ